MSRGAHALQLGHRRLLQGKRERSILAAERDGMSRWGEVTEERMADSPGVGGHSRTLGPGQIPAARGAAGDVRRTPRCRRRHHAVRRQTVDLHPRRSRRDSRIARVEMLVKVRGAESDHRDVNPLDALSSKRTPNRSRSRGDRSHFGLGEVTEMVDVTACHHQAVPEIRPRVPICRRKVKRDRVGVAPEQAAR